VWKWLTEKNFDVDFHGIDVEVVDRRRRGNRRRRRRQDEVDDVDDVEEDSDSRLDPPVAVSTGVVSPVAPRASPEPSDVDPLSSPRWPRGSLVTNPGSAAGSPPLGAAPSPLRSLSAGSTAAGGADLDYYNSLRLAQANIKQGNILHVSLLCPLIYRCLIVLASGVFRMYKWKLVVLETKVP